MYREAVARIAATGGVEAVTYARHLPLVGEGAGATVSVMPEVVRAPFLVLLARFWMLKS